MRRMAALALVLFTLLQLGGLVALGSERMPQGELPPAAGVEQHPAPTGSLPGEPAPEDTPSPKETPNPEEPPNPEETPSPEGTPGPEETPALSPLLGAGPAPADAPVTERRVVAIYPPNENLLVVLPQGGDPQQLVLLDYASCEVEDDWRSVYVSVRWDLDGVDNQTVGWGYVEGEVVLPEGLVFPGGDLSVRHRLLVYDPGQTGVETLVGSFTIQMDYNWVPRGSSQAARAAFYNTLYVNAVGQEGLRDHLSTEANREGTFTLLDDTGKFYNFFYPITYDPDLVDMDTAGSYPLFSGLPAYFQYSAAALQTAMIHVIDPEEVDLRAWKLSAYGGVVSAKWFRQVESPVMWVSVDGGPWHPADTLIEEGFVLGEWSPYYFSEDWRTRKTIGLQILSEQMVDGHAYEFEVRYEDGGRSVNSLIVDLTDGYFPQFGNGGGDRGGNDREETDPPPVPPGGGAGAPSEPEDELYVREDRPAEGAELPPRPAIPVTAVSIRPVLSQKGLEKKRPAADLLQPDLPQAEAPLTPSPQPTLWAEDPAEAPAPLAAPRRDTDLRLAAPPEENGHQEIAASPPPEDLPPAEAALAHQAPVVVPEVPNVPEVQAADSVETPRSPLSGPAAIAAVGIGGAVGAAALWKLLGKWLVKPR